MIFPVRVCGIEVSIFKYFVDVCIFIVFGHMDPTNEW